MPVRETLSTLFIAISKAILPVIVEKAFKAFLNARKKNPRKKKSAVR